VQTIKVSNTCNEKWLSAEWIKETRKFDVIEHSFYSYRKKKSSIEICCRRHLQYFSHARLARLRFRLQSITWYKNGRYTIAVNIVNPYISIKLGSKRVVIYTTVPHAVPRGPPLIKSIVKDVAVHHVLSGCPGEFWEFVTQTSCTLRSHVLFSKNQQMPSNFVLKKYEDSFSLSFFFSSNLLISLICIPYMFTDLDRSDKINIVGSIL